jgi:hypothetical protein
VTLRPRERHEGKRNLRSVLFLVGRFDEIEGRNPVGLVYFCAWSLNGLTLGVATDDVFEADPGGFPRRPFGTPVQKKVTKPRTISLHRGFFMSAR